MLSSLLLLFVAIIAAGPCHALLGGCSGHGGDKRLPCLSVSGSYYEVGRQLGEKFRDEIHDVYENSHHAHQLKMFDETASGQAYLKRWLAAAEKHPSIIEELKGIADGSGISLHKVFLYHCTAEVSLVLDRPKTMTPACSDMLVQLPDKVLIGHNEDGSILSYNTSFLLQAEIVVNGTVKEKFVAFTYAGHLPGMAYGFNQHGLTFSFNAIFGKEIAESAIALPRALIGRLLVNSTSVDDLLSKVQQHGSLPEWQPVAPLSGNVGDHVNGKVINVEFSPGGVSIDRVENGFTHHFNMFIHTATPQYWDPSTVHRTTALLGLTGPSDADSIKNILSDRSDPHYPLFREGVLPDRDHTLSTVIFDLIRKTASVFTSRPLPGTAPAYTFSLEI